MSTPVQETTVPETAINDARVNPRTGKPATAAQGVLLLIASCIPILGAVLLAPVLPAMAVEFADVPGADVLVPIVLTVPALFIAILAPFAGAIVDKLGRKRTLIISLLAYAVLGTAPLWIEPLQGIIATRVGVGIVEAFIMTACTTLIGDYFFGRRRERYFSLQAVVTALAATVFLALGGALGGINWRVPFALYSVGVVVAIAVAFIIWPTRQDADGSEGIAPKLPRLQLRPLVAPLIVTLFGGVIFYTLVVEFPFILAANGVTEAAAIGGLTALAALATAVGALSFRALAKRGPRILLVIALLLAGIGMIGVALAWGSVPAIVGAVVVASLGTGLLLPTLITWAVGSLPYEQRGRGTGLWTASIFLGQFFCPIVVVIFTGLVGGLGWAIGAVGVGSLVLAVIVAIVVRSRAAQVATS